MKELQAECKKLEQYQAVPNHACLHMSTLSTNTQLAVTTTVHPQVQHKRNHEKGLDGVIQFTSTTTGRRYCGGSLSSCSKQGAESDCTHLIPLAHSTVLPRGRANPKKMTRQASHLSSLSWQVPAHILTGFLGSGKTTLLNHILQESRRHFEANLTSWYHFFQCFYDALCSLQIR